MGDFRVKSGIFEGKMGDFRVKWGIFEEKMGDFRTKWGNSEEKWEISGLNGRFLKRKRVIFA